MRARVGWPLSLPHRVCVDVVVDSSKRASKSPHAQPVCGPPCAGPRSAARARTATTRASASAQGRGKAGSGGQQQRRQRQQRARGSCGACAAMGPSARAAASSCVAGGWPCVSTILATRLAPPATVARGTHPPPPPCRRYTLQAVTAQQPIATGGVSPLLMVAAVAAGAWAVLALAFARAFDLTMWVLGSSCTAALLCTAAANRRAAPAPTPADTATSTAGRSRWAGPSCCRGARRSGSNSGLRCGASARRCRGASRARRARGRARPGTASCEALTVVFWFEG